MFHEHGIVTISAFILPPSSFTPMGVTASLFPAPIGDSSGGPLNLSVPSITGRRRASAISTLRTDFQRMLSDLRVVLQEGTGSRHERRREDKGQS